MTDSTNWWSSPRTVTVVVDNDSWILPFAERLVADVNASGDRARLACHHDDIGVGHVAFFLGCVKITPPDVLARHKRNLVVHASDLPKGRGFSPLTWQILAGVNAIPICLMMAQEAVDEGPILYRDVIEFRGDELLDELQSQTGARHVEMALRYLSEPVEPKSRAQSGVASHYHRRWPTDSRLDPNKTIAAQFNLLRTVDNDRYPAFFDHRGCRYVLRISKADPTDPS